MTPLKPSEWFVRMSWTALTARASHWHAMHTHMLTVRHGICWAITKVNDGWPPPQKAVQVLSKAIQVLSQIIQVSDFIQVLSKFIQVSHFHSGRPRTIQVGLDLIRGP
jgi:hypothetical protein